MKQRHLARLMALAVAASLWAISDPGAMARSKGQRYTVVAVRRATVYRPHRRFHRAERHRVRMARRRTHRWPYRTEYFSSTAYRTGTYSMTPYRSGTFYSSTPYRTSRYTVSPYRMRSYRHSRSRTAGYRSSYPSSTPAGWSHGRKRGWRGHAEPPGHWRKD